MKYYNHEDLKELLGLYAKYPILNKYKDKNTEILTSVFDLTQIWVNRFAALMVEKQIKWKHDGYV